MEKIENKNKYNMLATRAGFNSALRHFKTALGFSNEIEEGYNLADILNASLEEKTIDESQIKPIVNILLADKFGYSFTSQNLEMKVDNVDKLVKAVKEWNNIQLVIASYNSSGDLALINPENESHWKNILPLDKDELIICYAGSMVEVEPSVLDSAAKDFISLLYGKNVKPKKGYTSPKAKKIVWENEEDNDEAPQMEDSSESVTSDQQIVTGRMNMSAKVSIIVTNELFHNGNVEAWKRIIESYKASHEGCEVHVWYDGEKINDINALFKWGKVKHGNPILFSVSGDVIKDISKLKKYLFEGASPRFEAFLHGHPGTVLELF